MQRKCLLSCCMGLILTVGLSIIPYVRQDQIISPLTLYSEPSTEWDDLFQRTSGWLGADGAYSVVLTGDKSLWLFSDTFIGDVHPESNQFRQFTMVNQSMATLKGNKPNPDKMEFIYGHKDNKTTTNLLENNAWLQDGIMINNHVYLTAYQIGNDAKPITTDLIRIPIEGGNPNLSAYQTQSDVPLMIRDNKHLTLFGIGMLDNTSVNAPKQDDYLYIYGYREVLESSEKALVVARVKKSHYTDLSKWRFWDGKRWNPDIETTQTDQATLTTRISAELSVVPITSGVYQGKYMLIYTKDVISGIMEYAISDSPSGPFTQATPFYTCPEKNKSKDVFCYNAKAHPHLSKTGQLLISYNVNQMGSFPKTNDVYRPRFVSIDLNRLVHVKSQIR